MHVRYIFCMYTVVYVSVHIRVQIYIPYTVHCTKNFANPHKLLCHGSHLWRLALASHCLPQLGEQCFAKYGFMAEYMDS